MICDCDIRTDILDAYSCQLLHPLQPSVSAWLLPEFVAFDVLQDVHPTTVGLLKAVVVELPCAAGCWWLGAIAGRTRCGSMDGWMGWDGTGWDGCMHLPIWLSMYLCIYVSTRMYLYTSVVCIRNSLWNPVDSFIHGMNYLCISCDWRMWLGKKWLQHEKMPMDMEKHMEWLKHIWSHGRLRFAVRVQLASC
jgi:hypothetical protein